MRFSITISDDLVKEIDEYSEEEGIKRVEWIRRACLERLREKTKKERNVGESLNHIIDMLKSEIKEKDSLIVEKDMRIDEKEREICRMENIIEYLYQKIPTPEKPKRSIVTGFKSLISGPDEED